MTITFWHVQAPDDFRGKLLNEMIEDFMKQYPEIKVEATFQGSYTDLYKKLVAAVAAGTPPDAAVSYPSMISDYLKAKAVVELDQYINDPEIGLSADRPEGHLPGLPGRVPLPPVREQVLCLPLHQERPGHVVQPGPDQGRRL